MLLETCYSMRYHLNMRCAMDAAMEINGAVLNA